MPASGAPEVQSNSDREELVQWVVVEALMKPTTAAETEKLISHTNWIQAKRRERSRRFLFTGVSSGSDPLLAVVSLFGLGANSLT
jgi:hypothetical protein